MGFLDKAIRQGIGDALGKAIGGAVKNAVTPIAEKYANQTAQRINETADAMYQAAQPAVNQPGMNQPDVNQPAMNRQSGGFQSEGLQGAFANLRRSMESYATEASKSMKLCPACGAGATSDKSFCPSCGARLPQETVAQGAQCARCGRQNTIGTTFCSYCGAKLPAAMREEQAAAQKDAAALDRWDSVLGQFPKWCFGGTGLTVEMYDGYAEFHADFPSNYAATDAVRKYRAFAQQNGFMMAGQYPSPEHLYRMAGNTCYHIDTEHLFEAGSESIDIYFNISEPEGGFYYHKPDNTRQRGGFMDLFR